MIVTPSFLNPGGSQRWPGYSGWPAPEDVDPRDPGRITERRAWLKYALMSRVRTTGANQAMVVPFRGELWGLGFDGAIELYREGTVWAHSNRPGAMVVNSWL